MPFISAHSLKCYNKPSLNNYLVYAQMATENVGGIQYTVDADTSDLITAEAVVKKSSANMANSIKNADTSVKNFNTSVSKSASGVKKAMNANLGQAGIQVQQFVGQLQGGQSAMVALAQQSADLGIVLGAPLVGVIVSLGAVLLGTLLPSLMSNKTSADDLTKAIERVQAVMTVGSGGVVEYTEKMRELYKVNEQLAKIKLAETIINQNEIIKNSSKAIVESAESTSKFYKSTFENLRSLTESVAKDIGGDMADVAEAIKSGQNIGTAGSYLNRDLDNIAKKFKITRSEALELGLAMSDVAKGGGAVAIKSLQNVTEDLAESYGYSNEKLTKLSSGMIEYFIAAHDATDGVNELRMALFDKGQAVDEDTKKTHELNQAMEGLTNQFVLSAIRITEGERAAFKFSLQLKGLDEEQVKAQMSLYDYDQELKKNKEDQEASAKAAEDHKDKIKKLNDELDAYFDKESADSTNQDRKATATLTTQVQSIGLTPEEEIQARYDRELELLQQAEEKKIEIEGTYAERRTQIEAERLEALRNLNSDNIDFLSEAFSNLDTQIAGTMAQVVVGAKDGETAMRDLASTMITQVVGALVQQGVELVKNKVLGNVLATSEKANILSTTATGVAAQQTATASTTAAAATTATAAAPAAALTSTFSFGSAALIGGAALLGTLAISKMMASGAREFGGPVTAGKSYLVGERGPEMFTPNTSGGIVSNKDMAGGGSPIVNVYGVPDSLGAPSVTMDDVNKAINIRFNEQISGIRSGTGAMAKALKGTTTNKGRATRA